MNRKANASHVLCQEENLVHSRNVFALCNYSPFERQRDITFRRKASRARNETLFFKEFHWFEMRDSVYDEGIVQLETTRDYPGGGGCGQCEIQGTKLFHLAP